MLIPLHPKEKRQNEEDAEHGAAFENFLLEEGLVLLRSFRSIQPPDLRYAILNLVATIHESLKASAELDLSLKKVPPILEKTVLPLVATKVAQHGSLHPDELTTAEVELVCNAFLECQAQLVAY